MPKLEQFHPISDLVWHNWIRSSWNQRPFLNGLFHPESLHAKDTVVSWIKNYPN